MCVCICTHVNSKQLHDRSAAKFQCNMNVDVHSCAHMHVQTVHQLHDQRDGGTPALARCSVNIHGCVCVYTYMFVCGVYMCVCVCVCVCVYIYIYIYIYTHTHTPSIFKFCSVSQIPESVMHACMHPFMHHVCMFVCTHSPWNEAGQGVCSCAAALKLM
jgi:hypothetical protein